MTTGSRPAVSLKGVAISFGNAKSGQYEAVSSTNLQVDEREFLAIVGPTGCGKSTLLNAVAGLLVPGAGSVEIFGKVLNSLNRDAGYLFQQDSLMPWKTVMENVAIGLEVTGMSQGNARQTALEWLEKVGLAALSDRFPATLSGGQRKRTGLAQVLIRNPKILLMDEPFGPLDAQTRQIMGDLMLKLWSEDRKAVLFVTHDLDEAIALADRVVIMSAGPGSRIIGDYRVPLARPRDIVDIRHDPQFIQLHRDIWQTLRDEVMTAFRQTSGAAR